MIAHAVLIATVTLCPFCHRRPVAPPFRAHVGKRPSHPACWPCADRLARLHDRQELNR